MYVLGNYFHNSTILILQRTSGAIWLKLDVILEQRPIKDLVILSLFTTLQLMRHKTLKDKDALERIFLELWNLITGKSVGKHNISCKLSTYNFLYVTAFHNPCSGSSTTHGLYEMGKLIITTPTSFKRGKHRSWSESTFLHRDEIISVLFVPNEKESSYKMI